MNIVPILFTLCLFFCLSADECTRTICVIWQIDKARFSETDWVEDILSQVNYQEIEDGNYQVIKDSSIIVIPREDSPELQNYFRELKKKNFRFGVIQVGDETYTAPTSFYPQAQFVLRNYWHKQFVGQDNVYFLPLGYKSGFLKDSLKEQLGTTSQRPYVWSFAGQVNCKPTRAEMIAEMKKVPHFFIYETFAWADPHALSATNYRELLKKTIFVPCPTGFWNLDSFRIYEALEVGAIPIVEKQPIDYFSLYFGAHPFIAINHWREAPEKIKDLLENPYELEKKRVECFEWWKNYKECIRKNIRLLVEENL